MEETGGENGVELEVSVSVSVTVFLLLLCLPITIGVVLIVLRVKKRTGGVTSTKEYPLETFNHHLPLQV